ncbi:MAG: PilZ domain-containing protein [Lachnospiraceae bacterium]|nr:PilZ domain-containing protein [Lachnospiraceae bacterium]
MQEKRRNKRIVLDAHLIMKRLDPGKNERIPVDVLDLSKSGIGFSCNQLLEMGAIYEAELQIWTKEVIQCFVNITRMDQREDSIVYGATFVGLTDNDACKISIYDMFEEARKNNG